MSALEPHQPHTEPAPIWHKRKEESAQAFAAFVIYRDQTPPRSIAKVGEALGQGERSLKEWSREYGWVERAAAYTDHLDRLYLAGIEDDIVRRRREVNERISEAASALHYGAMSRLYGVADEKQPVAAIDFNTLDADDIVRWFESSAKWGRLSIGLPSDVTGAMVITLQDLHYLLRTLLELAEKRLPRSD